MTETTQISPKTKPVFTESTLAELGASLPHGLLMGGELQKDIGLRPWKLKQERQLGALMEKHERTPAGTYVAMVLATMCTRLGHHDLEATKTDAERQLVISSMTLPDVLYAYLWLRVNTMGKVLELDLKCNQCGKGIPNFQADLETVKVRSVSTPQDEVWEYQLKHPIDIRGKTVTKLYMGSAHWSVIVELGDKVGRNIGAVKAGLIRGSIRGIGDESTQIALVETELDEMFKVDFETLTTLLDTNGIGPDLSVEDTCPHCGKQFTSNLDWTSPDFFGVSSKSSPGV